MSLHLAEIAACVAPGAHAVLLLDQAGWHLLDKLVDQPWIIMSIGFRDWTYEYESAGFGIRRIS